MNLNMGVMGFVGILLALFFAIILTAIFRLVFRNTGPWGRFWIFFVLMFFISFVAGEWAAQSGSSAWRYYWMPGLIAAIVIVLILAAASQGSPIRKKNLKNDIDVNQMEEEEEVFIAKAVLGVFLLILIITLALIAIAGLASKI